MKIMVSITGQDQRRLADRVEQLARARIANAQPQPGQDASPTTSRPPQRRQRPDRRS